MVVVLLAFLIMMAVMVVYLVSMIITKMLERVIGILGMFMVTYKLSLWLTSIIYVIFQASYWLKFLIFSY